MMKQPDLEDDQLGLFVPEPEPAPEPATAAEEPTCGWRAQLIDSIQPCVLDPDHRGDHVVWSQGHRDLVVWTVDPRGGARPAFRARMTTAQRVTSIEVRELMAAAKELADR